MRYRAPSREAVDPVVFGRPPLSDWSAYSGMLRDREWPSICQLNAHFPPDAGHRFVAQTPTLLADCLHYEQRIAERGQIATRPENWHDLLNALIWLRYPAIKQALNARQVEEIARVGPRQRTRPQYALTHFDEAGVVVTLRDPSLLALWDAHDWYGLFWQQRSAWLDGRIDVAVFGHALLELALDPGRLLLGKALVFHSQRAGDDVLNACAQAIASGHLLRDPLDLRPLPLAGIPGWHMDNATQAFHRSAACYQPKRTGRVYPAPSSLP